MSASVSEHQKNKGQGYLGKPFNNKLPNGPKEHHSGDRDEVDSWRSQPQQQQQHHQQGYSTGIGGGTDPYMPYYGSFQYPTGPGFGVNDGGPWSTNGGEMAFMGGGYSSGIHDSAPPSAHYNNIDGGMFGGGNTTGFGTFGTQPGFGYGFHGNGGDYNAWGQPRKPTYDDYYRSRDGMYGDDRGMKMVDGMGGLSLGDKEHSLKEMKEMMSGNSKKTTWATIASQPAKPQSLMKKKAGMSGMPPPPIMLGTWEKNGSVPKTPIAAPVQAPHPPAWERMERVPKMPLPPSPQPTQPHPQSLGSLPPSNSRGGGGYQGQINYNNNMPLIQSQPHQPPPPLIQQQPHSHNPSSNSSNSNHLSSSPPSAPNPGIQSPASPQYPDEAKMKSDYNPAQFDLSAEGARFFVIKSYSEDDIHRSIKYEIWCSTENGNKRLDDAWREREGEGPIYLFFSVNASGHFCGMAQMMSGVDHEASSSVWCQDKWKGQFKVKWVYVKDVPNPALRHIRLENNENKSVTNSRDTQEVPHEKGKQVLKILHSYHHTTSIFDDFVHYEKRQEEEDHRRTTVAPSAYNSAPAHERVDRSDRGRGSYHRVMTQNDHQHSRDRNDFGHRENSRGDHHHRGERDSHHDERQFHGSNSGRGGMRGGAGGGFERENFGGRGGGFDRNNTGVGERDFYRDRGDHHRGGGGRGGGRPPRN